MSQNGWISIIAMLGWLALVVTAYRGYRVGIQKTLLMIVVWAAIFLLVAALFTAFGA